MIKIPLDSKILSLSHNDCDGIGCQIVLGNVFKNITYATTAFYNVDQAIESILFKNYDYVFITDIHPTNEKYLDLSNNIILIDHHPSSYHNPNKNRWVVSDKNKCATYLVKYFIEKMFNKSLSHLDKLVTFINDYDVWELKYKESKWLNDLYFNYYRDDSFRHEFIDGRTTFTKKEIEFLNHLENKFDKAYDEIELHDFENINGTLIFTDDFANEIADALMKKENYDIVFIKYLKNGRISIRTKRKDVDVGKILDHFQYGGGHQMAAGFFVKTNNELEEKIRIIIDYIYKTCEGIRK
jgi:oligoribonuclease NrnB/cAMP/cGMP phosphodiesterase (DHH superfamily)